MSSRRNKWSEFEEIFKLSDSSQAISVLKDNYTNNDLIKFENKYGKGLLHMSVELDKPEIAEYLLSIYQWKKNQINRQDGRTPLALALTRTNEEMLTLLCRSMLSYSWDHITGHSRYLEFGNARIAEIFRSAFRDRLHYVLDDVDYENDSVACNAVNYLLEIGWPQDASRYLGLGDNCISCAQLYYAVAAADVLKVKHCLDNDKPNPEALMMSLDKAVALVDPKAIVLMKLLMDYGAPLFNEKHDEAGFDMLKGAFWQNNVDKALVLMHGGVEYSVNPDYFIHKEPFEKRFGTECTCLSVFVKPAIVFEEFLKQAIQSFFYEDYMDDLIRYHARIDSYEFPTDLKFFAAAYGIFERCRSELNKMKATIVYENLNLRDIIDKPINDIVAYTYNKELMDKLDEFTFIESFPAFHDIILKRLEVARRIRDWTDQSKDFLAECIPAISLNDLILSKIVNYLGVPNLIVLSWK